MLLFKFQGRDIDLSTDGLHSVRELRVALSDVLCIALPTCKVIGLKTVNSKKTVCDDTLLSDLAPQKNGRLMVLGTKTEVVAEIEAASSSVLGFGVIDDLDIHGEEAELLALVDHPDVQALLRKRIMSVDINILNPPREGKKLLVLDIDYTLFDLGGTAEKPMDLARPYLHEFLASAYETYDLVIWSATSMKWVEVKMRELGVLSHPSFQISFMLDYRAMILISVPSHTKSTFDCKPLAVIWGKFDQYTPQNTVMVDDLRQNFVLNPQNGLKCRAYRKSHLREVVEGDKELWNISIYLRLIAGLSDLSSLNHKEWERFIKNERRGL